MGECHFSPGILKNDEGKGKGDKQKRERIGGKKMSEDFLSSYLG